MVHGLNTHFEKKMNKIHNYKFIGLSPRWIFSRFFEKKNYAKVYRDKRFVLI